MKIKSTVTINMGLYMDIRPEITIDTENIEGAKKTVLALHKHFYKFLEPNSPTSLAFNKNKRNYETETVIQAESELDQQNAM